ncbi:MAG: TonB family protein [Prolixibacteraceae bacterium]
MEAIGLFLLKSAAWLTGFALVFLLALRNERYFMLNRIFLLGGILASLLFPLYTFHYTIIVPAVTTTSSIGELSAGEIVAESSIPLYYWIYLAGILAFFFRMLFQTWRIIRKLQITGYEQTGAVKLVRTPEFATSFSFFSFVFVNPSIAQVEMEEIMNHEREHIHQRHWFDLILVELVCIVQWFNPFAWVYAHLVRQNHEFLADERALQSTADPAVYQAALLNQLLGVPVFCLTNSFSYSLNKKRFKMMKKTIDSPFRKLKMLAVLPVAAFLFYAFSTPEYQFAEENSTISPEVTTIDVKGQVLKSDGTPLPGTSVILKGSTLGTMSGPEGKFELKGVPSDGELYFSFVGFQTKVQKVSKETMKIVMEISKVGLEQITVVGYGTPPPPASNVSSGINGEVRKLETQDLSKSMNSANPPLIILDGIPIDKKAMDQIDPNNIQSISVLKDKSATAVYGTKGKNGVILIKLKDKNSAGISGNKVQKQKGSNEPVTVAGYGKDTPPPPPPPPVSLIRGFDSAKLPLIILDGVEIDKNAMNQLNPSTIDRMDVLKDQPAIEKYGEKGKNGVIMITTKITAMKMLDKALRILDGNETDKATMDQLSPASIERMYILKDPSKTASYGEKGKNGVILVYTKEYKLNNPEKFKEATNKMLEPVQRKDGVYLVVEEMPEFPGGEMALRNFIGENIKYPVEAKEKGIQGKVFVTFVVNSKGKVENAKIARGVDPSLDNEALRVVGQLPEWKPGKQKGEAVSVSYTVPINFALDNKKPGEQVSTSNTGDEQVFVVVEEMPEFPGGELALRNFIAENIKYPAEAKSKGIQGKVFVTFVVSKTGKTESAKIARGVDPLLDSEALRVVASLPEWKPGKQRGVNVNVSYTIPVQFKLDGGVNNTGQADNQPKAEKQVFIVVEEMPEFPGGPDALRRFLAMNVKYPAEAQKAKTQGKVYVSFVINAEGKVEQAKIEKSVDPALDAEAIRVVGLMPEWKPGKQRGTAVSVSYTIPIQFKLQ